jgi:hypothetical protein
VSKREGLVVTVIYVILTLFVTYPAIVRLDSHYIGAGSDLWIFPWNDWWIRKCLLECRNPFYTTWMFYPEGVSLVYHNFAWLNTMVWLPLSPLVGPIAAYNLIFILNLALGGIGMYALARYLVGRSPVGASALAGNRGAAFLAGLIFAFWPFRLAHYNHPNMISTGWVPLFLLYLIRTVREEQRPRNGLLTGVFLGLTGLARWLHLALAVILAALYLGYSLLFERQRWEKRTFAALALAGLVAALIIAPFAAPLAVDQVRGGSKTEEAYIERAEKGADLVGYVVPERGHPLFQHWLRELWARMGQESFVGYTVLIMAFYGALRACRGGLFQSEGVFWLLMTGLLFTFALGGELRIAGQVYHLPMPYHLVQSSPFAGILREPRRFNILLGLPVAVLAAYGASGLFQSEGLLGFLSQRWGGRSTWVFASLLSGLVLFEYLLWPFPTVQPRISPFYQRLAHEPGDFGLLELPMGATTPAKLYMYYATVHGKPLIEGHVSRLPESAYRFIDSLPLTHDLHHGGSIPTELNDVSRQLDVLAKAGIRYVILHKDLATPKQITQWRDWLAVASTYEDDQIVVYPTALQYGRDFRFTRPSGEIGDGIGVISATLSTDVATQGGLLEVKMVWGTRQAPEQERMAHLALVRLNGEEVQGVNFEPCPGWPTTEWGSNAVAHGRGALRVAPFLEGGTYKMIVGLTGLDDKAVEVGQIRALIAERVFEIPQMEKNVGATFGNVLQLLGYDLHQNSDQAVVELHWQALRRMDVSYKFFVHLNDAESDAPVAQADVMPHNWTYPTTWWEIDEVVSDSIALLLEDVPPGSYRLWIGVYRPDTGERLSISKDPSDFITDGGRLMLPEEITR